MKKVILTLVAILGLGFAVTAQTSNAIGVRGAFGDKYGAELSYQQALGSNNRLEMDLGWYNAHVSNKAKKKTAYYKLDR